MKNVKAKKHLGQHFLTDENIALDIVNALSVEALQYQVLEIGPGMGVLTKYLKEKTDKLVVVDLDKESVEYLEKTYPELEGNVKFADFLRMDIASELDSPLSIIGNFPYNISSQIFFKVLEHKNQVVEIVGMLQKEVAERIASPPGNKDYGILSVLLQAYYDITYLFTVEAHVFNPPPKVRSGVIRLKRNSVEKLDCDEKLFKMIVKQGFQNRRKTLRNALKPLNLPDHTKSLEVLDKRAEQLSVADFIALTNQIQA